MIESNTGLNNRFNITQIIKLIFKRIRPALGLVVGPILMYSFLTEFDYVSILIALSLGVVYVFGDLYNDFWDFDDDKKNYRKEKLTVSGFVSKDKIKFFAYLILLTGVIIATFTNLFLLFYILIHSIVLVSYSHSKIRLKKLDLTGYFITSTPFLLIPFTIDFVLKQPFSQTSFLFAGFMFFQYFYILTQKDSTDLKDETNLFLKKKWKTASNICTINAFLASIFLLIISIKSVFFLLICGLNIVIKILNIKLIKEKKITRKTRNKIVGLEFLTPFLYLLRVFLWEDRHT